MAHGRKNICKITNIKGQIETNREVILDIVEAFFNREIDQKHEDMTNTTVHTKPVMPKVIIKVQKISLKLSLPEIRRVLTDMKNNKAPGKDGLVEVIKMGDKDYYMH